MIVTTKFTHRFPEHDLVIGPSPVGDDGKLQPIEVSDDVHEDVAKALRDLASYKRITLVETKVEAPPASPEGDAGGELAGQGEGEAGEGEASEGADVQTSANGKKRRR